MMEFKYTRNTVLFILYKNKQTKKAGKQLRKLLLTYSLPCVLFSIFQTNKKKDKQTRKHIDKKKKENGQKTTKKKQTKKQTNRQKKQT